MPELPECTIMADELDIHFANKLLTCIEWYIKPGKKTYNCTFDLYSELEKKLPLKLEKVWNRGKKIIFQFADEIYIVSSPLLTGSWSLSNSKKQAFQFNFQYNLEEIKFNENNINNNSKKNFIAVFNDDVKKPQGLSNIYFNKPSFLEKIKDVGPDYIHGNITLQQYYKAITDMKLREKQICEFLMDQTKFSGIGNYLKAEILYACKISPTRLIKNLTSQDIENLYHKSIQIINLAYASNGLTIKNYNTPDGGLGTFKLAVYGRSKDDNNYKVQVGTFNDKRFTYYVPEIQI